MRPDAGEDRFGRTHVPAFCGVHNGKRDVKGVFFTYGIQRHQDAVACTPGLALGICLTRL
jgi:hypothetical protein